MGSGPASTGMSRLAGGSVAGFAVGVLAGMVAILAVVAGLHLPTEPVAPPPDAHPAAPAPPPRRPGELLRVMPLGDSITVGVGSRLGSSYRAMLYARLRQAGLPVDFVGSQRSGTGKDPEHEGHGGWTVDRIAAAVETWLTVYQPDVILLHIGTNNITRGEPAPRIAAKLSALIDQIRAARPSAYVFVSEIVGSRVRAELVVGRRCNTLIRRAASGKGPLVRVVAQSTMGGEDLRDAHHPSDSGYAKMADNFYSALTQVFAEPRPARRALLAPGVPY